MTDPPDLSPYAPDGGCLQGGCSPALPYEANDNIGTADYGVGLQPDGSDAQVSNTFTIGGDGTLTFYLKVPARYSGDNVQVEVTKCDHAGNVLPHRVAGLSAVYTSWKRVFVERDRMFRRGGVLAASYDHATAEPKNRIRLWNWTNIQPGDQVVLFQADRPADSPAAERAAVKDPILDAGDGKTVWVDLDLGVDGQGSPKYLQQDYTASIHPTTGDLDFGYGQSAAVGVISGCDASTNQLNGPGSCFYDADMRDIEQPFDDAYVEFIGRREGSGAVPYISANLDGFYVTAAGGGGSEPGRTLRRTFQEQWFAHKGMANYIHALGVRGADASNGQGVGGFSWAWSLYLFMHVETLRQLEGDPGVRRLLEEASLDHEIGHEFKVNACSGFHDSRQAWCNASGEGCSGEPCLMQADGGAPRNATNRFCNEDLLPGDPACGNGDGSIRKSPDLVKTE